MLESSLLKKYQKGAARNEAKRIHEAERQHKECKTRAKRSLSELLQSALLALYATDSLELKLAQTAINVHTIIH